MLELSDIMVTDLTEFKKLIQTLYPDTVEQSNGILSIPLDSGVLSVVASPDSQNQVIIRAKIVSLSKLKHPEAFALDALCGNYFWNGTEGAKLSVGPDNALYITEQRFIEDLADKEQLHSNINAYQALVSAWQIRSQLYV